MRNTFAKSLCQNAREGNDIFLITGDIGYNVLNQFWTEFPDRFINAGISEQNMTSIAAGLAMEGKEVYTYSIANFPTLRCLEQIRNDIAYHNLKVRIISVGAGFGYGSAGMTHHATEDLAIMRSLPNLKVFSPSDPNEVVQIMKHISNIDGPCYIRLGKGGEPSITDIDMDTFSLGEAKKLLDGTQVAIFSTGGITAEAKKAAIRLNESGISTSLFSFHMIKPIDSKAISECAQKFELIVTVEEHNLMGGFGSAVAEILAEMKMKHPYLLRIGINDEYTNIVGDQEYLKFVYGLDSTSIEGKIRSAIQGGVSI